MYRVAIAQNVPVNHHHVVYIDGVARRLDRTLFNPVVILQQGADIDAHYAPMNYQLSLLPGKTYSPIGQLRFMESLMRNLLHNHELDLVHCINPFSSLLPSVLHRRRHRRSVKLIYDLRGLWVEFGVHAGHYSRGVAALLDRLDVGLMRQCDRVIAISPMLKEVLIGKGVAESLINVVPGGVNLTEFQQAQAFNYKSLGWDGKVLGYVASISVLRNSQDVIRAFDVLQRESAQPVFLAMIGPIYEPAYFQNMVQGLGLRDKVKFFGQVPHSQIPGLVKGLDIAVSYFPGEDHIFDQVRVPYKVLEYLAAGVPTLLTDQVCHRGLVSDRCDAYLVDPSVESLAAGMIRLCQDGPLRHRLTQNAVKTAERFSFDTLTARLETIYKAAITGQ